MSEFACAQGRIGLEGALIDALGKAWDSEQIAVQASRFRWDENIQRLSDILEDAAQSGAKKAERQARKANKTEEPLDHATAKNSP